MKVTSILLGSLIVLFFLWCGRDIEDPNPPGQPTWVVKSLPEDTIETGIDADPYGDRIFLQWHRVDDSDLEGYAVYRTEVRDGEKQKFERIALIRVYQSWGNDTVYFDETVEVNQRYLYYLRALDHAGNWSQPSDTIGYQLIEKADLISPIQGVTADSCPVFKWIAYSRANEFVIRLEEYPEGEVIWISRFYNQSFGDEIQVYEYNFDGNARSNSLEKGKAYRWRVDSIYQLNPDNTEWAGSESEWEYFNVGDK